MDLITRLLNDHIHINDLLDLFERQIERVDQEATAEQGLIRDIMRYLNNYPVMVHDHLEDLMFHRMLSKQGDLRDLLDAVLEQHAELELHGPELYQYLASLDAGEILDKAHLVKRAWSYLRLQRQHMRVEEREVFPIARELLVPQDYVDIIAEHEAQENSRALESRGMQYDSLYQSLTTVTRH